MCVICQYGLFYTESKPILQKQSSLSKDTQRTISEDNSELEKYGYLFQSWSRNPFSLPDGNNSDGDSSAISTSGPQIPSTTILHAHTEFERTSFCIKLLRVFGVVVARHRELPDLGLTKVHQPTFSQPTVKTRFFSFTQIWTQWDGHSSAFWGKTPCVYFNRTPMILSWPRVLPGTTEMH